MTFQERNDEGPEDVAGVDRVLTEEEVHFIILNRRSTSKKANADAARLYGSYCLLQKRVTELKEHHEQFVKMVARDLNELTQEVKRL